ncbi:zinc finger protein 518A, partial [Fukomys damarensis]|uniref:zinc finger protein 518A n=1 Tax=Fukomys damarensis TaxID=885580 RepID=UPI00053FD870
FIPLHVAKQPGFHVVSGRPLPLVNTQSVPASLLLSKKPGIILTLNNRKPEDISTVKTENIPACGIMTKEPSRTSILKVEQNRNCLTPALCSSIGSCLSMKSSSENTSPLKGPYFLKTLSSSRKAVPTNFVSEEQGTKLNVLDSVKQQNENFPKSPLYTLLPDGKQAVLLKFVMPNNTELLKSKLVQNSAYYQNIPPKRSEGIPQKILLKIFNPVLNVTAANNMPVTSSVSSFQKDSVPSNQTVEQKEPESSRDALPILIDDLTPANEIVITSTTTCPESSEQPIRISDHSEARILTCKTSCMIERNFNRRTSKRNFSKITSHIRSNDSETSFLSRNRNCKRKCKDSYQEEPPRKKSALHRKCKKKAKAEDVHETFGFSRHRHSKDSVRILRLFPFHSTQLVKCPRKNQPVVVLNHPDADTPEVANVMKTVTKFNGHIVKVSLSKRTVSALQEPVCYNPSKTSFDLFKRHKTFKPVTSVKERFVLKLTLKKTSKNNYQIVKTTSENVLKARFNCWFCGRVFDNQDAWAGHGQRHLMEATRDWNVLE